MKISNFNTLQKLVLARMEKTRISLIAREDFGKCCIKQGYIGNMLVLHKDADT